MDIGAVEIVACVGGKNDTQIVKGFGNYTVDLQSIGIWLKEHKVKTVATECIGSHYLRCWKAWDSSSC